MKANKVAIPLSDPFRHSIRAIRSFISLGVSNSRNSFNVSVFSILFSLVEMVGRCRPTVDLDID